jgi:hypothetical protein
MKHLLEIYARVLALLWAGFWIYFFIAESLASPPPVPIVLSAAGVGLVFIVLAFLPWRWEFTGGLALVIFGVLLGSAYAVWAPSRLSAGVRALTAATFGAPPLLAGILFLVHRRLVLHHA